MAGSPTCHGIWNPTIGYGTRSCPRYSIFPRAPGGVPPAGCRLHLERSRPPSSRSCLTLSRSWLTSRQSWLTSRQGTLTLRRSWLTPWQRELTSRWSKLTSRQCKLTLRRRKLTLRHCKPTLHRWSRSCTTRGGAMGEIDGTGGNRGNREVISTCPNYRRRIEADPPPEPRWGE